MRKLILLLIMLALIATPVCAMEFTVPDAPDSAQEYMPETTGSFGKDLWYIIKSAISKSLPSLSQASTVCVSLVAVVILISIVSSFKGSAKKTVDLVGTITVAMLLLRPSNALIRLGVQTVEAISEYGKLLLPVMTAALAAEGGATTSAALYAGTLTFNTILTAMITKFMTPMIYVFIALSVANYAIDGGVLTKFRDSMKWLMTWCLKISIYLFTGYLGITGVISGKVDAAAIKATKLAFSGFVPVVGGIISDASEAVLVSAGIMKSSVGVYGLLAILAIWIGPFIQIGVQHLLLKIIAAVCGLLGNKETVGLINDFSTIMGFVLAITGTVCLLLLVSIVCFMRGVS